jgi:hypothetical protein
LGTPKLSSEPKRKVGRPKTSVAQKLSAIPFDLQKIETMAREGLTDVMIGSILCIDERTLTRWKADPKFVSALKKGKDWADSQVIKSLYQRAVGYDDEKAIYFSTYEGDVTKTPYTKHYAPDVVAQIFWLKNRQSVDWRDRQDITSNGETIGAVKVTIVRKK